ncbi:MAG: LLM class flavin-dependent oxidoreductase [Candidatus Thorarchaeota archaeon]
MSDIHDLAIGVPGPFLPPWENALKSARLIDSLGYDSMAFPDHFAGFIPQSLWTPDITPLCLFQESPHTFYEMSTVMAACAAVTERVRLISAVTEPIRRHPVLLAQTFLTLDHISNGRVVMGIGAGEIENTEPYGLNYTSPVERLREALEIIRTIWKVKDPFSFEGKYFTLRNAVMSLRPARPDKPPPIWIAAHGPKMIRLAAEFGDGWIPTLLDPRTYSRLLGSIRSLRKQYERTGPFTAALWRWHILDEDPAECDRLAMTPLARALSLLLPASEWTRLGFRHPLGDRFYSLTDYVPMRYDRETMLNAINSVPPEVLRAFYSCGDADSVIKELEEYCQAGLDHMIIWNVTGMFDLNKTRTSYKVLKDVLSYVRG